MSKSTPPTPAPEPDPVPTFTLSVPAILAGIEDLKKIDAKISEGVGTIGKITGESRKAIVATPMQNEEVVDNLQNILVSYVTEGEGDNLVRTEVPATWDDVVARLDLIRSLVQIKVDEAVTAHAGETIVTHRKTVETLQATREARYKALKAMYDVLSSIGPSAFPGIDKVVLPSATGATRGRPARVVDGVIKSGKVKIEVYRVTDDGKEHFLAKGSPLNLVAFRWFGECGIEKLQAACEAAGIDTSQPWDPTEVTVEHNGKTYSHKIGGQLPSNPDA